MLVKGFATMGFGVLGARDEVLVRWGALMRACTQMTFVWVTWSSMRQIVGVCNGRRGQERTKKRAFLASLKELLALAKVSSDVLQG